jgi:hypothetical protein
MQCMLWILQMLEHFHHTDGFKHHLLTLPSRVFGQIYLGKRKLEVSSWLKNASQNRIGHIRKSRRLNVSSRFQINHITDFHHIFPNQTKNLEMEQAAAYPNQTMIRRLASCISTPYAFFIGTSHPPLGTRTDDAPRTSLACRTLTTLILLLKYFWRREVWF